MNRRGFLTAMAAAPVAAFVAPAAAKSMAPVVPSEPVFGSSIAVYGQGVRSCGVRAVDFGQSLYVSDPWHMTARLSQSVFDGEISVDEANAAYWDELVEVEA